MRQERQETFDPRIQGAIDELRQRIRQRYPNAQFTVTPSQDEPKNIHLITAVDLDDPDEVLDLVLERLIELEVEERILAELKEEGRHDRVRRIHSVVGRSLSPAEIDL